ncbi:hypothetical protein JXB28_04825 [Candidatus Woesearchaeota archaeon]|nr:hypothetical protein [Candidatus Woesearchaeota archaeon]
MVFNDSYYVFLDESFRKLSLRELVRYRNSQVPRPAIWSARISSGLLGLTNCKAGNRGPKGYAEVLLAIGDRGLNQLVDLGFIPCPECHPENQNRFWNIIEKTVQSKYILQSIDEFASKEVMPFDVRRIDFEYIMPLTKKAPNRTYLPRNLKEDELAEFKSRFHKLDLAPPPSGYYDPNAPGRFTRYF